MSGSYLGGRQDSHPGRGALNDDHRVAHMPCSVIRKWAAWCPASTLTSLSFLETRQTILTHQEYRGVDDDGRWQGSVGARRVMRRFVLILLRPEQLPTLSPSGSVRLQVQITTTSDWATLTLKSGGTLNDLKVISWSPEATDHGASDNRISINQTIERANSGGSVEIVVDVTLSDVQTAGQLEYLMESGALGDTNVKFYTYLQDSPVEASTAVLQETSETIYVPIEKIFLALRLDLAFFKNEIYVYVRGMNFEPPG